MRILTRATLREFWENHADAEEALINWHKRVETSDWTSFQDVKQIFGSADVLPGNRVVFNIKGNTYRLIVKVHYDRKHVYIRFIGTHAEYDKIDAETI